MYKCIKQQSTLLVELYGSETLSPILRGKSRLWVFENRFLRRMFGSKRDDNGEWRRHHNEELNSLYRSPNIVRVNGTYYEVPDCGVFSTHHFHPSRVQTFASGTCFQISLACEPPLLQETLLHNHIAQLVILLFYIV